MPLVSVIIPVYNADRTLLETVDSVQNQTLTNIEIIIINDGSTDRTLDIIQNISDARVKVFSYKNGGLPTARNRGIAQATGEFISFIDADDLWTPDKLARQLAALEAHPEAAVAYSWTQTIDEQGHWLHQYHSVFLEGDVYPEILVNNFVSNGSNVLVRKEAILSVGEFDSTLIL
jgi:glycosyltransferase involved in cell wall biosynthesis